MPEMPAAPAAAPAPAPAPAAPAPAAAPAPSAPAASPSTPATPEAPAAPQPAPAAPAAEPAAPAAAPAAAKPAPKSSDYAQNEEGLVKFLTDYDAWAQENPEAAAELQAKPGEQPAAQPGEQKPEEKPAEQQQQQQAQAEPLPQAFQAELDKDPALKAALEANPAAQKLVMEAARASEAARPILEIVPTKDAAEFMARNANTVLDLRHNFLMGVDNPEAAEAGWNGLLEQFMETDDKGQPMKDAAGRPVYGKDLEVGVLRPAVNMKLGSVRDQFAQQIKDLEQKVQGYYPSEAARDADLAALDDAKYARDAVNYALALVSGEGEEGGMPELPVDATPEQRAFQERLQRQQDELKQQQQAAGQGRQKQEAQQFESKMRLSWQAEVGKTIDGEIKAATDRGEYIPDYILQRPWIDPATKQATTFPALAVEILNEFDARVMSVPTERAELQRLQRLGPAGEQQRAANAARLRTQYLPEIVRKHISEIQDGLRKSQAAEAERHGKVAEVARTEPQSAGGAGAPVLTDAQVEEKAQASAQRDPAWRTGDRETRFAILARERTRAKFGY